MSPRGESADLSTDALEPGDGGENERRVPFGKYVLLGKVARGGMAEIYRAMPVAGPQQMLAVKCMRGHLARESRFVEMFIREGKLAMLLQHPGIVRTFDVGSVDGRYFITMEYLAGQDLNAVLRRCQETSRRVPIPHAIHIAVQVCRALHYAHTLTNSRGDRLNIVNRDVSPSNVRLSYDGEVKLLDFGIAQAVLQVSSEIGVLKGKFSYMSPEQVRGLPVDRRSDVFSTGIVLHEMLACERLFRDESEFVLMEKVRRAEVTPPSAFNKRVPPDLDAVVMRALQREPSMRYQSAEEMALDLERLLEGYQFTQEELGELVRGLFPSAFRDERQVGDVCLTDEVIEEEEEEPEPVRPERRPVRRRTNRPPRKRRRSSRRERAARRKTAMLLAAAAALLLAAVVILMVALL